MLTASPTSGCSLEFSAATGETLSLVLELDGGYFDANAETSVLSSTLIEKTDGLTLACGGPGTVLRTGERQFEVDIESLAPQRTCPGTAIEGQLSGTL